MDVFFYAWVENIVDKEGHKLHRRYGVRIDCTFSLFRQHLHCWLDLVGKYSGICCVVGQMGLSQK